MKKLFLDADAYLAHKSTHYALWTLIETTLHGFIQPPQNLENISYWCQRAVYGCVDAARADVPGSAEALFSLGLSLACQLDSDLDSRVSKQLINLWGDERFFEKLVIGINDWVDSWRRGVRCPKNAWVPPVIPFREIPTAGVIYDAYDSYEDDQIWMPGGDVQWTAKQLLTDRDIEVDLVDYWMLKADEAVFGALCRAPCGPSFGRYCRPMFDASRQLLEAQSAICLCITEMRNNNSKYDAANRALLALGTELWQHPYRVLHKFPSDPRPTLTCMNLPVALMWSTSNFVSGFADSYYADLIAGIVDATYQVGIPSRDTFVELSEISDSEIESGFKQNRVPLSNRRTKDKLDDDHSDIPV